MIRRLLSRSTAQALDTPVRTCVISGARLPSYFLLGFGIAEHPETAKPWQMPRLSTDSNAEFQNEMQALSTDQERNLASEQETPQLGKAPPTTRKLTRVLSSSYMVAQHSALDFVSSLKRSSYVQTLPYRWRMDSQLKINDIVWRKDMSTFVLELMRRKTARLLLYLSRRPAAYVVKCNGYEGIKEHHQVGAALWLGDPCWGAAQEDSDSEANLDLGPPPFAMVDYESHHIPVYNLPSLLGSTHMQRLRESQPTFAGGMAVLKRKHHSIKVLMDLWKLMGYLTPPGGKRSYIS